jgi:hypothetical protein
VTIRTGHEMDVVGARRIGVSSLHCRYVDTTVGELWMAIGARAARIIGVRCVACAAAQALMDAPRCAIVTATRLVKTIGRMTLDAEALARVRGHANANVVVR